MRKKSMIAAALAALAVGVWLGAAPATAAELQEEAVLRTQEETVLQDSDTDADTAGEETPDTVGAGQTLEFSTWRAKYPSLTDRRVIQVMLDEAKSADGTTVVHIPSGTYSLDEQLRVYPNTTLSCEKNTTFEVNYPYSFLRLYAKDGSASAGGYGLCHDVTLKGGVYIQKNHSANSPLLGILHAQNITLDGVTLQDCRADHMAIISGCKNVTVKNCVFKDVDHSATRRTDYADLENLHLDYISSSSEPYEQAKPWDGTPTRDVTITGCTFENGYAGVGNHEDNGFDRSRAGYLHVYDCTFKNIAYTAVNAYTYADVAIQKNTVTGSAQLAHLSKVSSGIVADNTVTFRGGISTDKVIAAANRQVFLSGVSTQNCGGGLSIRDMTFARTLSHGVFVNGGSATLQRLTIQNPAGAGLQLNNTTGVYANSCTITNPAGNGIWYNGGSKGHVSSCTITGAKSGAGLFVNHSVSGMNISNNTISGTKNGSGLQLDGGSAWVYGNRISSSSQNGVMAYNGAKLSLYSDTIQNNTKIGVDLTSCGSGTTVQDCTITGNGQKGIFCSSTSGLRISASEVRNNGDHGVHLVGCSGAQVRSTTITGNKNWGLPLSGCSRITLTGDVIRNNKNGAVNAYSGTSGSMNYCSTSGTKWTTGLSVGRSFADAQGGYFLTPVHWAVGEGITNGTDATHFSPYAPCTRGQIVTFLYKAKGSPAVSGTLPFRDVPAKAYYRNAVLWAVQQGITSGTDATHFAPNAPCTRAQAMTFLYRAAGKPAVSATKKPFADVAAGKYYTDPILWASSSGITSGVDAKHFGINNTCTRGQIVTFLYKARFFF